MRKDVADLVGVLTANFTQFCQKGGESRSFTNQAGAGVGELLDSNAKKMYMYFYIPSPIHLTHLRSSFLTFDSFSLAVLIIQKFISLCKKKKQKTDKHFIKQIMSGFLPFPHVKKDPMLRGLFQPRLSSCFGPVGVKSLQRNERQCLFYLQKEREPLLCLCHGKNFSISQDLPEHQPEIS